MLSVIIATDQSERLLLPTLAALVPGSVEGVVREVIVADGGSEDATAEIADAAGCRYIVARTPLGSRLRAAAASARANWLLFLPPGAVLEPSWIDDAKLFIQQCELSGRVDQRAAVFRAASDRGAERPALADALAMLAAALGLRGHPARGLLISKRLYEQLGSHRDESPRPEQDLLRRLGRRRITALRSSAIMASG